MPSDRSSPAAFRIHPVAAALALAVAAPAWGQSARTLAIKPTFSATQSYTDNRTLDSGKQSDLVTQLSPGVRILSNSGPVQGALDYQLTGLFHAHLPELNETRNALNASVLVKPFDERFSVATRATITRQTISAFGTQPVDSAFETRNSTEVASVSVAPRLVGTIAGLVDYELQAARDISRAKASIAGDVNSTSALVRLSGRTGRIGWGLDASRQRVDYREQPRTTDDRAFATLSYVPDADLRIALRGGIDRSEALGEGRGRRNTYGGGVQWQPSLRTSLLFDADRRYFGNSHSFSFQHRMARSVWSYTDTRNVSNSSSTRPGLTAYELFSSLFAGLEPDPVKRDQLVLDTLRQQGIDPGTIATSGFLTSSRSLSRNQQAAVVLNGQRSSLTASAFRSESQTLTEDQLFGTIQPPDVTQLGYSLIAAHRLTPRDSVSLSYTRTKTLDTGAALGNDQKIVNLLWSTQPGLRTSLSLGGRHVVFDGPQPYTENGLNATLSLQF